MTRNVCCGSVVRILSWNICFKARCFLFACNVFATYIRKIQFERIELCRMAVVSCLIRFPVVALKLFQHIGDRFARLNYKPFREPGYTLNATSRRVSDLLLLRAHARQVQHGRRHAIHDLQGWHRCAN